MKTLHKILVGIIIIAGSCTGHTYTEKATHKIDSLLTQLDSAQALLLQIKSDSIAQTIKLEMKRNAPKLSALLDTLPPDNQTLTKTGAYMNLYKFFKKLDNKTGEIAMNLTYTVNQLNDLKHDIPLLAKSDTSKLNQYLNDETKATKIVVQKTHELFENLQQNKSKYHELKSVADSLLNL